MGEVIKLKTDGLTSLVSGMNDPMRDKMATTYYGGQCLTDLELLNAYRFTWLGRKIVDIPAQDAVRKGRDWQADQKQIELIEKEEKRLGFWGKLLEVQVKARLWGGAALFIGTGEEDNSRPLDVNRIGKGGIKYLTVLNRRDVSAGEIEQDVTAEWFGKPSWYEVTGTTSFLRIHPSRLCVFVGNPHPDPLLAGVNTGWGDSALDSVFTAMKHSDATAANIASLVFEANVDIFKIPDFMQNLSDPEYEGRIMKRTTLAALMKGNIRALLMDASEEYERKQITFATLPEVMQTFLQMVSGAADIPVTRLLGQSPAGMNSTGESDMKNYHDRISSTQNMEITPAIQRLDECLIRSALGARPEEIFYSWSPLEQMSEKQLAEIGKMNAETAKTLFDTGIFTGEELRTVVTTQMVESSFYPGLDQVVAETGDIDFSEPEEEETDPDKTSKQTAANDAEPRTLYVRRDVVNAAEITAWAKSQGMTDIVPDLHVTIVYSRTAIDWIKAGNAREWADETNGGLIIPEGGPRVVEPLGGMTAVLMFASGQLYWRHKEILEAGAVHGFEDYQPHISLTKTTVDLSKVEPFRGKIVLGPEIFEEVKGE